VIVLNGGSSAGKTSAGRALQAQLPGVWFLVGIDTFLTAAPVAWGESPDGVVFGADGSITFGAACQEAYGHWRVAVAALARAGTNVILDEVFLAAAADQDAWAQALAGIDVLWVGLRCPEQVAAERERARGDRTIGIAAYQAVRVHAGVRYDVDLDSATTTADELATAILAAFRRRSGGGASGAA